MTEPATTAKTTVNVIDRWNGKTLHAVEVEGEPAPREAQRLAVLSLVKDKKPLSGVDLIGAYLRGAYLRGADLSGADLSGADLSGAYLRGADLRGADLSGAYLRGADLRGAYLSGAYLRGADLRGAKINWQSHTLIAELLLRAAGDDVAKRKVAGFVAVSLDLCWDEMLEAAAGDPLREWALDALAEHVTPDDRAPRVLAERAAARLAAEAERPAAPPSPDA